LLLQLNCSAFYPVPDKSLKINLTANTSFKLLKLGHEWLMQPEEQAITRGFLAVSTGALEIL